MRLEHDETGEQAMLTWHLHGSTAELAAERLQASIDLQRPHLGLHALRLRDHSPEELATASLLRLQLPGATDCETIAENWVRTNDLIAVYAPTPIRPSQPEIYWRALLGPDACGIELIVSVHTDVLDDYPRIELCTELPAREALWLPQAADNSAASPVPPSSHNQFRVTRETGGPGVSVVRLPGSQTYLEMVYPSDFCSVALHWQTPRLRLETSLFPERLEKGVIRRGRIQGWLLPTVNDLDAARHLYDAFARSEIPLTT